MVQVKLSLSDRHTWGSIMRMKAVRRKRDMELCLPPVSFWKQLRGEAFGVHGKAVG